MSFSEKADLWNVLKRVRQENGLTPPNGRDYRTHTVTSLQRAIKRVMAPVPKTTVVEQPTVVTVQPRQNELKKRNDMWDRIIDLSVKLNEPILINHKDPNYLYKRELNRLLLIKGKREHVSKFAPILTEVTKTQPLEFVEAPSSLTDYTKQAYIQSRGVKAFFDYPVHRAEYVITGKLEDFVSHMRLHTGFNLLLVITQPNGTKIYRSINRDNFDKMRDLILVLMTKGGSPPKGPPTGSDAEFAESIDDSAILSFEWRKSRRTRPTGGYFPYYHKLSKVDLSRYGIYLCPTLGAIDYSKNCLQLAFENAGFDFSRAATTIKTRFVPQKDLQKIADILQVTILVKKTVQSKNDVKKYNVINPKGTIKLGLINEHYFLIEQTKYTKFSIEHYFQICDHPRFNESYKFGPNGKPKFDASRFADSFAIISLLAKLEKTHLEQITLKNCGPMNTFKQFEYTSLIAPNKDECKPCVRKALRPPRVFSDLMGANLGEVFADIPNYYNGDDLNARSLKHSVLYFDTESTTDETFHKEFFIKSETRDGFHKEFFGEYCILNWLKSLTKHYICIAHNLRYDFQFVLPYLYGTHDLIKTGNMVKAVSGYFFNKDTQQKIHLYFKDSYSFIAMPLRAFGDCFKLEIDKEVMPYKAYNKDTIKMPSISIDYALQFLDPSERTQFLINIDRWGLRCPSVGQNSALADYNHIEYVKIYCRRDVEVLKKGYEIFRGWMYEATKLDIDYAVSLPQIAYINGLNNGVFNECFTISGVARDFIQRCVVGGRCMTRRNEKFKVKTRSDALDYTSLYPSAMAVMDGFLMGLPKVMGPDHLQVVDNLNKLHYLDPFLPSDITNLIKSYANPIHMDGFFVEIEVLDIGKKRDFPLISRKDDKGVRNFSNQIRGDKVYVDKTSLEDLVKYQDIKFRTIRGYYFDEGRNTLVNSFISNMFDLRAQKKKEKNPIQAVYKLLLNSFYGKLIQNPIEHDYSFIYGEDKLDKFVGYNFNSIESYCSLGRGVFYVKQARSVLSHFSMPHCGVEVLSMSKRLMNQAMCLAEDLGIPIYYQDTDSMHLDMEPVYGLLGNLTSIIAEDDDTGLNGFEYLCQEYEEKYNHKLAGNKLGQMHSDFEYESDTPPIAIESIYLGKKSYLDVIQTTEGDKKHIHYHSRLKGVPSNCLYDQATIPSFDSELGLIGEIISNEGNDILDLYNQLYEGESKSFDLTNSCKFKIVNGFLTSNTDLFLRTVSFNSPFATDM